MNSIDYQTKILLDSKKWEYPQSLEELGYIYFGPLLFNYFVWLKSEIDGCDKILFNSREGYFLQQIYELFKNKFDLPESVYFKTSRRLSASFFNEQDIYETFNLHRYSGKLSNLLKHRFGIELNGKEDEYINSSKQIPDLSFCVELILKKSKKTREEYGKYITQIIGNSKNVMMVDTGYQGTTQYNIEKAYGLKFKGRYIIYKGNLPLENVKGFYDFYKGTLKDNIIFLESIFIDKVGTYIDIVNGEFINEKLNKSQKYFENKKEIIQGIKDFTTDMLDSEIDFKSVSNEKPDYIFNLMCKKGYVKNDELFDIFVHDNYYSREYTKKVNRK
jgi:hypothetical protein